MLRFLLCLAVLVGAMPHADLAAAEPASALTWTDIRELGVEGQGWTDTQAPYDRLPAKAEGKVRGAVWSLSRHSAGLCVRFVTDAPEIHARWVLTSGNLAMPHMAATGVSGLDLYVKTERGPWRWLAVGKPESQTNTSRLVVGLASGKREYLLYLPLYNGTRLVALGNPASKTFITSRAQTFSATTAKARWTVRFRPISASCARRMHLPGCSSRC